MTELQKKKTNVEYLRDLIIEGHEERIEFLEAVEKELEDKDERILDLQGELEDSDDEAEPQELEYEHSEDIYLGVMEELKWDCPNLAVKSMMEVFIEKLKKHGALKLENLLSDL